MSYFFDTYAIIEILRKNENYQQFFEEAISTSIMNIGELYYALLRDFNETVAEVWRILLEKNAFLVDLDIIIKAIKFRFANKNMGFSFVDCIGYTLARENNLIFVTGDIAFEHIEHVAFVK